MYVAEGLSPHGYQIWSDLQTQYMHCTRMYNAKIGIEYATI